MGKVYKSKNGSSCKMCKPHKNGGMNKNTNKHVALTMVANEDIDNAEIDKEISEMRTTCCDSEYDRKGRAHYVCSTCKEDVSMHFIFHVQAIMS